MRVPIVLIATRSNVGLSRPFSPRRGAEQWAVVDASSAHTFERIAPVVAIRIPPVASTGGRSGVQGLAFLVTFGAMPKVTGVARPWSALVACVHGSTGSPRTGDAVLFIPSPPHPNPLPRGERGQGREGRGDRTA